MTALRQPDEADSWAEYYATIDQMLDADRPTRALPSERDWQERSRGWARNHIVNESEIVRHYADEVVARREGLATKAANKMLRTWMAGQAPLDWTLDGRKPIKLKDGTRVRLDAATPDDLRNAARELARQLKLTYETGMVSARAMWLLAAEASQRGLAVVSWLGDQAPAAANTWDVNADELDWDDVGPEEGEA